jgi:hypothetical protein
MLPPDFKFPPPPSDADFTALQNEGEIKISEFKNQQDKYISAVSDTEYAIEENSRYKYLATFISQKGAITDLKIQRYTKRSGGALDPGPVVSLPIKQVETLRGFLKFLSDADLGTLASGKFVLADNLTLEPELYGKLVSLSGDALGKETLIKLFDAGYLTSGFDIPDLIKRGLTQSKIEEKRGMIDEFEKMISRTDVKEVADIQAALAGMPWIFGPEYVSLDIRPAGDAGIPDRRLKRIDGLSDILEVKLPKAELLRKDSMGRQFIAPELAEALGQLTGYLEHYYSVYSAERDDASGEEILEDRFGKYYKPRGILLIGRREPQNGTGTKQTDNAYPKHLRRLLSYFHWVEVLTYDDLIDRARNGLDNLLK